MAIPRFVLSDESVNDHGFRVMTSGIDLSRFSKNPVMLWMHKRGGEILPVGRWTDLKVENGQLTALPEFDDEDDFAMRLKSKVEKGIINGASCKLGVIEMSNDPSVLMPGQYLETVTKSELYEASLVDYPSNKNSVRLCTREGDDIVINKNTVSLASGTDNSLTPKKEEMKKVILALGLGDTATEDAIVEAVKTREAENQALKTQLAELSARIDTDKKNRAVALVDGAITAGKILGDKKEAFVNLAVADYDSVKNMLEGIAPVVSLSGAANQQTPNLGGKPAEPKTFAELTALGIDAYEKFKTESPDKFNELYKQEYGRLPK
jgi:hypothetical protein